MCGDRQGHPTAPKFNSHLGGLEPANSDLSPERSKSQVSSGGAKTRRIMFGLHIEVRFATLAVGKGVNMTYARSNQKEKREKKKKTTNC